MPQIIAQRENPLALYPFSVTLSMLDASKGSTIGVSTVITPWPKPLNVLATVAIIFLSLGSFVKLGTIDQYGISAIVFVIPQRIYITAI